MLTGAGESLVRRAGSEAVLPRPGRQAGRARAPAGPLSSGAGSGCSPSRSRPSRWSMATASAAPSRRLIACDIAIAAEDAIFGLSEVNWGIFPGGLVSRVVADALALRDAMYYILTGDPFDGKQAAAMRLMTLAVPADQLRERDDQARPEADDEEPEHALRAAKEVLQDRPQRWTTGRPRSTWRPRAPPCGDRPDQGRDKGIRSSSTKNATALVLTPTSAGAKSLCFARRPGRRAAAVAKSCRGTGGG